MAAIGCKDIACNVLYDKYVCNPLTIDTKGASPVKSSTEADADRLNLHAKPGRDELIQPVQ
jgi:hypothetical protein